MRKEYDVIHFTLKEFIISATAVKYGVANYPSFDAAANLKNLCAVVLEPIRALCKCPMVITSGYRSTRVNELVGGEANSFHLTGHAADFTTNGDLEILYELIKFNMPWLTECIYYRKRNIIHVAYAPELSPTKHFFTIKNS